MEEEVKKILDDHERRIQKLEKLLEEKTQTKMSLDDNSCIRHLSQEIGVSEEQLKCIFDFDKEDLNLICSIEGKNEEEKQLKATLCILTAYYYCFNKDNIKSQNLRKKLEWLGIKSLGNLSTNLAKYKQFIIPKGKPKSPEYAYKITFPGLKKGKEIIKELATKVDENEG